MSGRSPFQQFFPFLPDYSTWDDWVGNVIIFYGQHDIMTTPEEHWQEGAQHIAQSETFGAYPVPSPLTYDNWQDWAREFTEIINGKSH
jgi:hypothetical protein